MSVEELKEEVDNAIQKVRDRSFSRLPTLFNIFYLNKMPTMMS